MRPGKEKHILIVEDDAQVRGSLATLLRREGYEIHEAESAAEGLRLVGEQPIQLAISDYNLGGMSGIEFFKLLRERHPHVLRILITGATDPDLIIRSINEGEVYRFIRKPWDNTMLRVMLYFAFETITLEEENRRLLAALRRQINFLHDLERDFPYLAALARDEDAALLLAEADLLEPGTFDKH